VRYGGGESPEYGIVVHCWFSDEIKEYDCYVAFFGHELPIGSPEKPPYILRYASVSLDVIT
jgi:hypothetical protein